MKFNAAEIAQRWRHQMFVKKNVREKKFQKKFEKINPPEIFFWGSNPFRGWDSHPTPPHYTHSMIEKILRFRKIIKLINSFLGLAKKKREITWV
jgi:hypothetical protein